MRLTYLFVGNMDYSKGVIIAREGVLGPTTTDSGN